MPITASKPITWPWTLNRLDLLRSVKCLSVKMGWDEQRQYGGILPGLMGVGNVLQIVLSLETERQLQYSIGDDICHILSGKCESLTFCVCEESGYLFKCVICHIMFSKERNTLFLNGKVWTVI